MLRQTLMTTNKNIVHSSGVIILSYKNEFRGKLFFLWVDHEKAHRTTLRTFTQQPPVHSTLSTAEILSGKNAQGCVSMALYLRKSTKIKMRRKILRAV